MNCRNCTFFSENANSMYADGRCKKHEKTVDDCGAETCPDMSFHDKVFVRNGNDAHCWLGGLADRLRSYLYDLNKDRDATKVYWDVQYKADARWPMPGEYWFKDAAGAWQVSGVPVAARCVQVVAD